MAGLPRGDDEPRVVQVREVVRPRGTPRRGVGERAFPAGAVEAAAVDREMPAVGLHGIGQPGRGPGGTRPNSWCSSGATWASPQRRSAGGPPSPSPSPSRASVFGKGAADRVGAVLRAVRRHVSSHQTVPVGQHPLHHAGPHVPQLVVERSQLVRIEAPVQFREPSDEDQRLGRGRGPSDGPSGAAWPGFPRSQHSPRPGTPSSISGSRSRAASEDRVRQHRLMAGRRCGRRRRPASRRSAPRGRPRRSCGRSGGDSRGRPRRCWR